MPNEYSVLTVLQGIMHIYSKLFLFMIHEALHDFQSGKRQTKFLHFNVLLQIQTLHVQVFAACHCLNIYTSI